MDMFGSCCTYAFDGKNRMEYGSTAWNYMICETGFVWSSLLFDNVCDLIGISPVSARTQEIALAVWMCTHFLA